MLPGRSCLAGFVGFGVSGFLGRGNIRLGIQAPAILGRIFYARRSAGSSGRCAGIIISVMFYYEVGLTPPR